MKVNSKDVRNFLKEYYNGKDVEIIAHIKNVEYYRDSKIIHKDINNVDKFYEEAIFIDRFIDLRNNNKLVIPKDLYAYCFITYLPKDKIDKYKHFNLEVDKNYKLKVRRPKNDVKIYYLVDVLESNVDIDL